jgi:hypothetical protein
VLGASSSLPGAHARPAQLRERRSASWRTPPGAGREPTADLMSHFARPSEAEAGVDDLDLELALGQAVQPTPAAWRFNSLSGATIPVAGVRLVTGILR